MFSHDTIKAIISQNELEARQASDAKIHEAEAHQQAVQEALTWGGSETSMLRTGDLPLVKNMIERLETKYGAQFEALGGTWNILGNGSRFSLKSFLPNQTESYTYTLVRENGGTWSLYYSGSQGRPVKRSLEEISNLSITLDILNREFPLWEPEAIFDQLTDTNDHTGHYFPAYTRLSNFQQVALLNLVHLFSTHHESRPDWTLVGYLQNKIMAAQESKSVDADQVWQYQVMMSLFTHPRSKYAQSYYYANTQPVVTVHDIPLAKLMALLVLAARDPDQVLRPQYQIELNKTSDIKARQAKKQDLINESFEHSFLFSGLYDIAREHSDDHKAGREDKYNHIPSCPGGAAGRSVFKLCPLNAVTAMVPGSVKEVERAAIKEANSVANASSFQAIPHEVENFIFGILTRQNNDVKVGVYRFLTGYMYGHGEQPHADATEEEKAQHHSFKVDEMIYEEFLHLCQASAINASLPFSQILAIMINDMKPENLLEKDFTIEIYAHEQDRNFIERLRKEGAKVLQSLGLSHAVDQDQEILSYRRQIRELSYHFKAIKGLVQDEIRRGLLASFSLLPVEKKKVWGEVKGKILWKLSSFKEQLVSVWEPRLRNMTTQLNAVLDNKIGFGSDEQEGNASLIQQVRQQVEYNLLLGKADLIKARQQATHTAENCDKIFQDIKAIMELFYEFQIELELFHQVKPTSSPQIKKARAEVIRQEVNAINVCLSLPASASWRDDQAWAREFVRVALTDEVHEKEKELIRLKKQMEGCFTEQQQIDVIGLIGKQFLACLKDPALSSLDWEARASGIRCLTHIFPDQENAEGTRLNLQYHTQISLSDLIRQGEILLAEESKEAFETAGHSLVLARFKGATDPADSPEGILTDPCVYQKSYSAWLKAAYKILKMTGDSYLFYIEDQADERLAKISQFVFLTVCRNLGLNDLRLKDKESLDALCRRYLTTPSYSGEGKGCIFMLRENTRLSDRLQYLLVHLSCLITTLNPIKEYYQLGYVRIMERAVAESILNAHPLNDPRNMRCIIRISDSHPSELVISGNHQHGLYQGGLCLSHLHMPLTDTGNVPLHIVLRELNIRLVRPSDLVHPVSRMVPELALVSLSVLPSANLQMRSAYHREVLAAGNRYFHHANYPNPTVSERKTSDETAAIRHAAQSAALNPYLFPALGSESERLYVSFPLGFFNGEAKEDAPSGKSENPFGMSFHGKSGSSN